MFIKSLTENAGTLNMLKFFSLLPLASESYWLGREGFNQYIKYKEYTTVASPCALYCFTIKGKTLRKHIIVLESKNSAIQLC